MANNQIVVDLQLNTDEAAKSLSNLLDKFLKGNTGLGKEIENSVITDLNNLNSKMQKMKLKMPTDASSVQQIQAYKKELSSMQISLTRVQNNIEKAFGNVSQKYITDNVKSLGKESQKYGEMIKQLEDLEKEKKKVMGGIDNKSLGLDKTSAAGKLSAQLKSANTRALNSNGVGLSAEELNSMATQRGVQSFTPEEQAAIQAVIAGLQEANRLTSEMGQQSQETGQQFSKAMAEMDNSQKVLDVDIQNTKENIDKSNDALGRMAAEKEGINQMGKSVSMLASRFEYMFSAVSIFNMLSRTIRNVFKDFQELDKQFNEIAIVSKYSTSEMWSSFSQVNKMAQEYGVTTSNILEVQNLYYHQGKDMAEVNELTAETLTLAKITGMDYADATNKMTAALNAYKISAENAGRVTDTIAALSANAATSSEELMTALTKTASIAANAGMSLENTEVFLTKMIETTREAPENLGTALKTIVARFGEVKKEIDGEEIELADVNKVDTALKSVGISILDTAGQMRDLDDVFMELSAQWDNLDRNTQRYIATQAAGSRQQSRFIAMMENYDRTLELTEVAQNSAGTGAKQLAKAQESIETAINRLKASWQEFYATFLKNSMFVSVINRLNNLLKTVNKIPKGFKGITVASTALIAKITLFGTRSKQLINTLKLLIGAQTKEEYITKKNSIANQKLSNKFKNFKRTVSDLRAEKNASIKIDKKSVDIGKEEFEEHSKRLKLSKEQISCLTKTNNEKENSFNLSKENIATMQEEGKLTESEAICLNELVDKKVADAAATEAEAVAEGTENAAKTESIVTDKVKSHSIKGLIAGSFATMQANIVEAVSWVSLAAAEWLAAAPLALIVVLMVALVAIIAGAIVGIVAITKHWKKTHEDMVDEGKSLESLSEKWDTYKEAIDKVKNLKDAQKTLEELSGKLFLTSEEQETLNDTMNSLAETYPIILSYMDDEGNYRSDEIEQIMEEIGLVDELAEAKKNAAKKGKEYTDESVSNAKQGILGSENSAYKSFKSSLDNRIEGIEGVTASDDEKTKAKKIAKSIYGVDGAGENQMNEFFESILSGDNTGIHAKDLQAFFNTGEKGRTKNYVKDVSDDQLATFMQAMYGQEVNEGTVGDAIDAAFEGLDDASKEAMIQNMMNLVTQLPEIGNMISEQGNAVAQAYQNSIMGLFSEIDLDLEDFELSTGTKTAFAKAVAGSIGEDFSIDDLREAMEGFDENTWKGIAQGLDINNMKIEDILGGNESFAEMTEDDLLKSLGLDKANIPEKAKKALVNYYQSLLSLDDNQYSKVKDGAGLTDDQLKDLTAEQATVIGQRLEALESSLGSFEDASNAYKDAKSKLNGNLDLEMAMDTTDWTSTESINKFINTMVKAGITAENTKSVIIDMAGDINDLPFTSVSDAIQDVTSSLEKFEKTAGSLDKLKEGTGEFEDFTNVVEALTNGLSGPQLVKTIQGLKDAITISADGSYGLDADSADEYISTLLDGEKSIYQIKAEVARLTAENQATTLKGYGLEIDAVADLTEAEIYNQAVKLAGDKENIILIQQYVDGITKAINAYGEATATELIYSKASVSAANSTENLKDSLEKATEAAEAYRDAMKELYQYLLEFDRYSNIDGVKDTLESEFEDLEFELEFTVNEDNIKDTYDKMFKNLNEQYAVNLAGKNGAQQNLAALSDAINKNYSKYYSIDKNGNLIANYEKIQQLQKEIAGLNNYSGDETEAQKTERESRISSLENEKENVEAIASAYNEAKDKVKDYNSKLKDTLKKYEELREQMLEKVVTLQDKLLEVIQAEEDKELEAVREKYELIKKEDQEYLDSVQKMVDKERQIRDNAQKDEDIKKKERKLAMMKMDTSGVYANDIASLEEDLTKDYQTREDNQVDQMIKDMQEFYTTQASSFDQQLEFMENTLEARRENMAVYYEQIEEICKGSVDSILKYIEDKSDEYKQASDVKKEQLEKEWKKMIGDAQGSAEALGGSLETEILDNLDTAKSKTGSLGEAMDTFESSAVSNITEVGNNLDGLSGKYQSLINLINGPNNANSLVKAYEAMKEAADNAAKAARDAANAGTGNDDEGDSIVDTGSTTTITSLRRTNRTLKENTKATSETFTQNGISYTKLENGSWVGTNSVKDGIAEKGSMTYSENPSNTSTTSNTPTKTGKQIGDFNSNQVFFTGEEKTDNDGNLYFGIKADGENFWAPINANAIKAGNLTKDKAKELNTYFKDKTYSEQINSNKGQFYYTSLYKFAKGGLVDFTGPAWVDGTSENPEAFLSASDVRNISSLTDILSTLFQGYTNYKNSNFSNTESNNITYSIEVNVDGINGDYDVDRAIERIEERIQSSAKYRNINIISNSK